MSDTDPVPEIQVSNPTPTPPIKQEQEETTNHQPTTTSTTTGTADTTDTTTNTPITTPQQQDPKEKEEDPIDPTAPPKDYPKIYEKLQDRFKKAYIKSQQLFEIERNQRQTLSYYHRRNQAILSLLAELEPIDAQTTNVIAPDRIRKIGEVAPRLKPILDPLVKLNSNKDDQPISKNHYLNLYLVEKIPDLINDDMISLEINPQEVESWCRRHYPNLVASKYKPFLIQSTGINSEYTGSDYPLLIDGNSKMPASGSGSSKKKRKLERK